MSLLSFRQNLRSIPQTFSRIGSTQTRLYASNEPDDDRTKSDPFPKTPRFIDVILCRNIQHMGKVGERVKVHAGLARNKLIPNGYAVAAKGQRAQVWAQAGMIMRLEDNYRQHIAQERHSLRKLEIEYEEIPPESAMNHPAMAIPKSMLNASKSTTTPDETVSTTSESETKNEAQPTSETSTTSSSSTDTQPLSEGPSAPSASTEKSTQ
eukprot:TRINITY_DN8249_c0_g1::TRINITY_DN8249_c0_g1_i1::g.10271::m.10271 TRINITY_DN8249_c0_g1::TRINITY_DN8249_c0_g1_i1::g.10271  ORF type:complete len:219 (+),score=29.81,sp/Q6F9Q8/RL9_ACIAD/56.41/2e-06,Ribosomal_L9_N/PF01281.14/3.2e-11 TRINITY_DN8249_c0_g1_i1:32-658(+)